MNFERAKINGLIGRNGLGKAMLMKCVCGFVKPTSGEIYVSGKRIGKNCDFPENVGIIIETSGFITYYSGFKNLKLLADLREKNQRRHLQNYGAGGLRPKFKASCP